MQRQPINPWTWSLQHGYNQAERVEGIQRQLVCAGQTAVDEHGAPQHPQDMRAQMELAFENLQTVLAAADMGLGDITRLSIYSTDVDATLANFDVLGAALGAVGAAPPMSLLGVTRLAMPALMFEIEATAAQ